MLRLLLSASLMALSSTVAAKDTPPVAPTADYSPYPSQVFPNQVFF